MVDWGHLVIKDSAVALELISSLVHPDPEEVLGVQIGFFRWGKNRITFVGN